jgi:hypothetical protein
MAEAIGSLIIRIGADAGDLIGALGKADTALGKTGEEAMRAASRVALIAGAAAGVAGALFAMTKKIADTEVELLAMSQKVGISVESLSALKFAAQLSDVSLESLGVGLKNLSKHMQEAQQGTGEAGAAFRALKINVEESQGTLKPTEEMLLELADRFSKIEDGAGKTALALRIFGKAGNDLIPFLNKGRDGIEQLRAEAERLGIIVSTTAAKQAKEFEDNLIKLEASSASLARSLAGPLITALGQVTAEMVKAKNEGDGFFATMARGLMATRTDSYRIDKDIVEATDRLLDAQKALDNVRVQARDAGNTPFDVEQVKRFEKEVQKAQDEVNRLLSIKKVMVPEAAGKPEDDNKPKAKAPIILPQGYEEERAKRMQAEIDMQTQTQVEIDQVVDKYNEEERKKAKDHADAMLQVRIDYLQMLEQAELDAGQEQLRIVEANLTDQERKSRKIHEQAAAFEKMGYEARGEFILGWLQDISAGTAQSDKKMFELNKAATLANALLKGHESIVNAYEFGTEIGGPYVGAAMAALAGAAVFAQINQIRSTQFNGGGGGAAPSAAGTAAPPVSVVQNQAAGNSASNNNQSTVIHFSGNSDERRLIRRFVDTLNENTRDGGRILIQ